MTSYNVYFGNNPHTVEASSEDTLSSLRNKLGGEANNYSFVYFNSFTEQKTILRDRSVEIRQKIGTTAFDQNRVLMTLTEGDKTDLFGTKTDWLYHRHAGVRIALNTEEQVGILENQNKFAPIMLNNVQCSNPEKELFIDRAVICEKGSLIRFEISSWGAAGFGFSITSEKDTICNSLYAAYDDNYNRQGYVGLRRYEDSNNSIIIDSIENLKIPTKETIQYQKMTVKTWRVTSYHTNGRTFTSNTEPPVISAPQSSRMMREGAERQSWFDSGFAPGETGGDTFIPGNDVEHGAPGRGPESDQRFSAGISNLIEDNRDQVALGAVIFHFLVFKDKDAANRVINILNAPNINGIG
jgi:hypothetical protein